MPHMYFYNTDTKQYRILPAGMLGRMSGDTEITQEEYKKAIGDELANERIQEANKVYENMLQPKPEKDYTQSKEPVAQRKNRIDEGYYIDRPLPPQQPQQTQFEQMMGYGAGQGSNPYGPRRVPYTKKDGTIVNVLEDYMGRPMQDIEGLTRVESYQAGPIFGGDTPAGGGIVSPVMPPMPVDPTDDTAARRERERKDDRKKAREAETRKRLDAQVDKDVNNLRNTDDRFKGLTFEEARKKYYGEDGDFGFKDRLAMAKEDLAGRPERFKTDFKNLIESLPDDLKNTTKNIVNAVTNKKSSNKKSSRTLSASERRAAKKSKELKETKYKDKKSIDAAKAETTKLAKEAGFGGGPLKKGGLMKRNYP